MGEIIKKQDHRREFIDTLIELAERDPRIVLIVPDVGFNYIEEFSKRFPERFFNFGVTEQSCILIATAMGLDGWKPYVYSMINFVLMRPFEMIRDGIVFHNSPVTLLGVKGGASYKFLGRGHNLVDDKEDFDLCDVLRLPWYNPQSNEEVHDNVLATYASKKPAYIRL
ncbi:MAG: hypothetical protein WAV09_01410 [Minisyncoccia bacterium]